jgi:alkylhydroperoxidase family enzyme
MPAPPIIYTKYPDIYGPWSRMSEALMNGPSPLTPAQRELIFAYAAGVAKCHFVCIAHSEVAYARGIERGIIERLLQESDSASVDPRLKPLLAFVRKLTIAGSDMLQSDADAVFAAGWDEHALHDAIALTARAAFMQRLVEGYGFTPLSRSEAAMRAAQRVKLGYVNLYGTFKEG